MEARSFIIHIPALGDPAIRPIHPAARFYPLAEGASYWPQEFSAKFLKDKRSDMGTAQFNAAYQADPTAMGGDVFKDSAWFRPLPGQFDVYGGDNKTARDRTRKIMGFDFAFSELDSANYTAMTVMGIDAQNRWYVLGAWRDKVRSSKLVDAVCDQWCDHEPHVIGIERGIWDKHKVVQDIVQQVRARVPAAVLVVPAKGDKVSRAFLLASHAEAGMVYADREAPWFPDWEQEHLGFDKAVYDDWVDSSSICAELAATKMAYRTDEDDEPQRQTYTMRPRTLTPA
jgi:predicted phage terminase large subunit-like protein